MSGSLAHAHVIERCLRAAEPQIFVFYRHRLVDYEFWIFCDGVNLFLFQTLDDIGLATHKRQSAGGGVAHKFIGNAGNLRFASIEILVCDHNSRVAFLLHKLKSSCAVGARCKKLLIGNIFCRHDREEGREIVI